MSIAPITSMGDVENGEAKGASFTKVQPMSEKPKRVPSRPNLAKTDSALQLVDEASRRAIVRMASHEESVAKTTSFGVRATISHEDSMNAHLNHVRDRFNWLTSGETSVDVPDATDADAPGHLNTHKERINWLHNGFDLPRDREAYTEVMGKQLPMVQRIAAAVSFVLFCGIALDVFEVGERPELHASFAEWGCG